MQIRTARIAIALALTMLLVPAGMLAARAVPSLIVIITKARALFHRDFLRHGTRAASETDLAHLLQSIESAQSITLTGYFDPLSVWVFSRLSLPSDWQFGLARYAVSGATWCVIALMLLSITVVVHRRFARPDYSEDLKLRSDLHAVYINAASAAVLRAFLRCALLALFLSSLFDLGFIYLFHVREWIQTVEVVGYILPIAFGSLLAPTYWAELRHEVRAAVPIDHLRCHRCSYKLGSSEAPCPECGAANSPRRENEAALLAAAKQARPVFRSHRSRARVAIVVTVSVVLFNAVTWMHSGLSFNPTIARLFELRSPDTGWPIAPEPIPRTVLVLPVDTWTVVTLRGGTRMLIRVEQYRGKQVERGYYMFSRFAVRCVYDAEMWSGPLENDSEHLVLASGGAVPDGGGLRAWLGNFPVRIRPESIAGPGQRLIRITSDDRLPIVSVERSEAMPVGKLSDVFAAVDWSGFLMPPHASGVGPAPELAQHLIDWE